MVARVGSRKARRFPLGVSGTPTCPSHRPQLALGAVVLANHTPGGRHGYHFPCARRCAIPCAPHYGQQLPRPHPVLNCLSRCKAMLTANEPMYGFALPQPSRLLQRCNPLLCRWGAVSHASHPKTRGRRGNAGRATPRISPLRTTPIGHSADPHSRLTNRKARRLVNEVEAHALAWTYIDNKKALSIYLLRAL